MCVLTVIAAETFLPQSIHVRDQLAAKIVQIRRHCVPRAVAGVPAGMNGHNNTAPYTHPRLPGGSHVHVHVDAWSVPQLFHVRTACTYETTGQGPRG